MVEGQGSGFNNAIPKSTFRLQATATLKQRTRERACSDGNKYVERFVATDILAAKSFDEILAPIRNTFQESDV